jgi:hypothetical protein
MQPRDNEKKSEEREGKGEEKRDLELENIVGDPLIAENQVEKLRTRLADLVEGFRPEMRFNKPSAHVFKHNNKWCKLSLRIDEVMLIVRNRESRKTRSQDILLREVS